MVRTKIRAVTASSRPKLTYPAARCALNRLASAAPAVPPTTEATPATADAVPRRRPGLTISRRKPESGLAAAAALAIPAAAWVSGVAGSPVIID